MSYTRHPWCGFREGLRHRFRDHLHTQTHFYYNKSGYSTYLNILLLYQWEALLDSSHKYFYTSHYILKSQYPRWRMFIHIKVAPFNQTSSVDKSQDINHIKDFTIVCSYSDYVSFVIINWLDKYVKFSLSAMCFIEWTIAKSYLLKLNCLLFIWQTLRSN